MIYLMLPIALLLGLGFVIAFIKMSLDGQYDDLETPAHRILIEDQLFLETKKNKSGERNE
jgi:cbb3-type cytochrome oxidase maturation protein